MPRSSPGGCWAQLELTDALSGYVLDKAGTYLRDLMSRTRIAEQLLTEMVQVSPY